MGHNVKSQAIIVDQEKREKLMQNTKGLFALGLIFVIPFLGKYFETKKSPEKRTAVWG